LTAERLNRLGGNTRDVGDGNDAHEKSEFVDDRGP